MISYYRTIAWLSGVVSIWTIVNLAMLSFLNVPEAYIFLQEEAIQATLDYQPSFSPTPLFIVFLLGVAPPFFLGPYLVERIAYGVIKGENHRRAIDYLFMTLLFWGIILNIASFHLISGDLTIEEIRIWARLRFTSLRMFHGLANAIFLWILFYALVKKINFLPRFLSLVLILISSIGFLSTLISLDPNQVRIFAFLPPVIAGVNIVMVGVYSAIVASSTPISDQETIVN